MGKSSKNAIVPGTLQGLSPAAWTHALAELRLWITVKAGKAALCHLMPALVCSRNLARVKLIVMSSRHTPHSFWRVLVLAAWIALVSGSALAQWVWVDNSGNKVFSDTAPPPGIPDKNVLRKPGAARVDVAPAAASTDAEATSAGTQAAAAPKVTGKDEQLEAKKKAAEKAAADAAQAKKKAEAEKFAAARAQNCERAKRGKASLDSGMRIATVNTKGEREIMDDKARAAEARRVDEVIRSDCGPLPSAQAAN